MLVLRQRQACRFRRNARPTGQPGGNDGRRWWKCRKCAIARSVQILLELRCVGGPIPRGTPRAGGPSLRAGEITGIAGVSGNGQATLSALIEGRIAPISGDLHWREGDAAMEHARFVCRIWPIRGSPCTHDQRHECDREHDLGNLSQRRFRGTASSTGRRRAVSPKQSLQITRSRPAGYLRPPASGGNMQKLTLAGLSTAIRRSSWPTSRRAGWTSVRLPMFIAG